MTNRSAIIAIVLAAFILAAAFFVSQVLYGLWPAIEPAPIDISVALPDRAAPIAPQDVMAGPIALPPGFHISVLAKNLPGARVMRLDGFGNMWVSRTSEGAVTRLEIDRDTGTVRSQEDIFTGLAKPHGLAFNPENELALYIAEEQRIRRFQTYSDATEGAPVLDLPAGEGHFTRTIGFGPDRKLYISVGSSCNVCNESDQRRAAILRYDPGTRQSEIFARGLRNAVFFTWHPVNGALWATEMGRDWLGDELPPDEINIVEPGRDYGWPDCYGKNVPDPFGLERPSNPCAGKRPSVIDIPAHSAPLGLTFIPPNSHWPEEYWYDLLVSYHGSWNRSRPTGYKVVRHRFDSGGNYQGVEDFITGWLPQDVLGDGPDASLGRPVDILIQPGGIMYLSDDKAGVIYKVTWRGQP